MKRVAKRIRQLQLQHGSQLSVRMPGFCGSGAVATKPGRPERWRSGTIVNSDKRTKRGIRNCSSIREQATQFVAMAPTRRTSGQTNRLIREGRTSTKTAVRRQTHGEGWCDFSVAHFDGLRGVSK